PAPRTLHPFPTRRSSDLDQWAKISQAASAPNPEERSAALRMLGDLQDRRALQILETALSDGQPSVRGAAAASLGDLRLVEAVPRSEEHTSELQSRFDLVC